MTLAVDMQRLVEEYKVRLAEVTHENLMLRAALTDRQQPPASPAAVSTTATPGT